MMINIDDLTFTYPHAGEPALKGLSLSVNRADFLFVTGSSGAGKSTLLRCLNGLVPHFSGGIISGDIQIDGIGVISSSPRALSQKVGFVFQDPESQSVLDIVEDEIAFVLENAGMPSKEMHERVDDVLDLLDLRSLRNRSLATLSSGERQKTAVATAIVLKPPILVLDEPTSQLDWKSAEDLLRAIKRLNQELDTTIIIVEQRLDRVIPFANRMLVMESGHITDDSPPFSETIPRSDLKRIRLNSQEFRSDKSNGQNSEYNSSIMAESDHKRNDIGISQSSPSPQDLQKNQPLLSVDGLTCDYGQENILNGVSLHVKRGEAVALVGRNGTGKTTILKSIVGILKPMHGDITVDGRSIQDRSVADICKDVAYLPQVPDDLLFADTVEQEFEVTLANHGLDTRENMAMIEHLLSSLELIPFRNSYPRDLSVGQRQRVAMGSVMVTGPKLILLDEPTRGLDALLKSKLAALLSSWINEGHGLLLVTHDLELARNLADRILILENGQVTVEDRREKIYQLDSADA